MTRDIESVDMSSNSLINIISGLIRSNTMQIDLPKQLSMFKQRLTAESSPWHGVPSPAGGGFVQVRVRI